MIPPGRGIYCNRTLNLRSIRAIGYDMDYTLIHYDVDEWERAAFNATRRKLGDRGWPVDTLKFDPHAVIRGLVVDRELGNICKSNRFGYIKRASHGDRVLDHDEQRNAYSRTVVDLREDRWLFLDTFFALSEASLYQQLVPLLDQGKIPEVVGYRELAEIIRFSLDAAHTEGELKARIMATPDRYVILDEETPRALLDQHEAGKKLLLITNSEWDYTAFMMSYSFDRFLPGEMTWRDLFEMIIVSANKPAFFRERRPLFEVTSEEGTLLPMPGDPTTERRTYLGGHARLVERRLGIDGSDILFVGDHVFSDVEVSKAVRRWRTAVIVRELEEEIEALDGFSTEQEKLDALMDRKTQLEYEYSQMRLEMQRRRKKHESTRDESMRKLAANIEELRGTLTALDAEIGPLAMKSGELCNARWGVLTRTGNDKSLFARQVEGHADIYTSRVSNFLYETPFVFFRSPRGSLPHDP